MFSVNSMATNWPREVCSAVSVAQTGVMAFRIPVPMPLKIRAVHFSVLQTAIEVLSRTANHPSRILCGALKASPNDCPSGRDGDRIDATKFVTNGAPNKGTNKCTGQVVHSDLGVSARTAGSLGLTHNASLEGRSVDGHRLGSIIPMAKVHDVDVASGSIYPAVQVPESALL